MDKRICIFGDSISCGYWDKEAGGWANRLWVDLLNRDDYYDFYNSSINGDTTSGLLNRMDTVCQAFQPELVIIFKGGNDAAWLVKQNDNMVPFTEFKQNLTKILEIAQRHQSQVLFASLFPFDEAKTIPFKEADTAIGELHYTYQDRDKYDQAIKELCQKENLFFLDFKEYLNNDYLQYLPDGVHPNAKGHEIIYQIVKKYLLDNKLI